jgi:hypothetical protein
MPKIATITITVEIDDEQELAAHAAEIAAQGGLMVDDWKDMRKDGDPVRADLIMVFDPGTSPPGLSIQASFVEIDET